MKHVMFGSSSLLTGGDAADLLGRYAALLARIGSADFVELRCINVNGDESSTGFLLNSGANLLVETVQSPLPDPDNSVPSSYMQQQLDAFTLPVYLQWLDDVDPPQAQELP